MRKVPSISGYDMARALVLVVFVSNYVVVLFYFDIVTNVLISPCIFRLIAYIILHLPNIFFRKIWTRVFIIVCQTVKNTHSNGLIKLLDLSNAFIVEYLLTARSSMPDISTSVLKQQKYKTDMCSCYKIARLCKLQKRVHLTCSRKW